MKVGFIGLGGMGSPMAGNLAKAGHELTVYNRTQHRAQELKPVARKIAGSPGEAASNAEVLISMLADDRATEETFFAPGEALNSLSKGAIHICMSTISIDLSRRLNAAHKQNSQHYIAAPVFGRPDAAAAAKLFIVAAGEQNQVQRCQPLFGAMGQRTFILGEDASAAHAVKLAGNFMITAVIESLAESFAFVRKLGVNPEDFLQVLTESLFAAPIYRNYGSMIARGDFDQVGFKLPLGLKDNRLLLAAADQCSVPMPLASLVHDRFIAALAQGLGEADWAAIARISYRSAGIE